MPMPPRGTALAKPSGAPAMRAVPQSGPIIRRPALARLELFSRFSSASGTLSLNTMTWRPARSAFPRLLRGELAGYRE